MYYHNKRFIKLKRFFFTSIWVVPLLFIAVNGGRVISFLFEKSSLKEE
ncbi:hypothetical protein ACFL9U_02735 [Thermodesulfobacteriota bacterium]